MALLSPVVSAQPPTRPVERVSLLPPFHQLTGWEVSAGSDTATLDNAGALIQRLGRHFNRKVEPEALLHTNRSPLEWPPVFATSRVDPRRQRVEFSARLTTAGIRFREIAPFDLSASAVADTMTRALAGDFPVVANVSGLAVIYGYDRREPDGWWMIESGGSQEIVLESERAERLVYWSDDPAAGVFWIIDGAESTSGLADDIADWALLRAVDTSVQGLPDDHVPPYPISLRALRDLMASSDSLPPLAFPIHATDPLGILRAKTAREQVVSAIVRSIDLTRDTAQLQPLKLAHYQFHSSAAALDEMALQLYEGQEAEELLPVVHRNWHSPRKRGAALSQITDVIKSEKQACEAVKLALVAREKLAAKTTLLRRRPR